jgi:predicted phage tail protein
VNPDEFCTSDLWSPLTSAASNSQLAGVLGGFLITAIAWTQGAVSTGMLAAGTTALFGGLGWMLASHAVNKVSEQDTEDIGAYGFSR